MTVRIYGYPEYFFLFFLKKKVFVPLLAGSSLICFGESGHAMAMNNIKIFQYTNAAT
jgi:hypothetical protein